MKKKVNYLLAIAVGILLAFCGLVGCAKAAPGGGKPGGTPGETPGGDGESSRLAAIDVSTIQTEETASGITMSWDAVDGAGKYEITCGEKVFSSNNNGVILTREFGKPSDGVYNLTIVVKAFGKEDSEPTKFTYKVEGVLLRSPVITKYENGILEWAADGNAVDYTVKVDGAAVFRAEDRKSVV